MHQPALFELSIQSAKWTVTADARAESRPTFPARMAPDNPELEIRDAVLACLEDNYEPLLEWIRQRMRALYAQRLDKQGYELAQVCADDARALIDAEPRLKGVRRNFMGQLFKAPGWVWTGAFTKSRTAGSHGNLLMCWRWSQDAYEEAMSKRRKDRRRQTA